MKTTIYLIRHAEAEGNVYRRCHGQYNSLLTGRGKKQLPYLANRFETVPLSAIYASDLIRAKQTADAIAQIKGKPVQTDVHLREIHMGEWEDLPWARLPMDYPEKYHQWQTKPWECAVPGGESVLQTGERVFRQLQSLAQKHRGEDIAVVSHGSAIRGVLCKAYGLPDEGLASVGWGDNTCVAKIEINQTGTCEVIYMHDASHLPEELSTFAAIGWKNNRAVPMSPQVWFRPVDFTNTDDQNQLQTFLAIGSRQIYEMTLTDLQQFQQEEMRAVSFAIGEGQPIALLVCNTKEKESKKIGVISLVTILPNWQGCGLCKQLIGECISLYRKLGRNTLEIALSNPEQGQYFLPYDFKEVRTESDGTLLHKSIGIDMVL